MARGGYPENGRKAGGSGSLILQLDVPGNEAPLQLPALIRNLGGGLVTLEVKNPWTVLCWETLKGQTGCLKMPSAESPEVTEIEGTVSWARYTVLDQDSGVLNLGLKLTDPNLENQRQLREYIPQTTEDIKGLWDKWEQVRQAPAPASDFTKVGFAAAVILLCSGLALQLMDFKGFKIFGWVLWFLGTLAVAGEGLRFWKNHRVSR